MEKIQVISIDQMPVRKRSRLKCEGFLLKCSIIMKCAKLSRDYKNNFDAQYDKFHVYQILFMCI